MAEQQTQNKNRHKDHRKRFRKEINTSSIHPDMPDHKVLEYVLFHCIPRKDTNDVAHDLVDKFGSFAAVLEAPMHELMRVKGINEASATWIKMMIPLFRYYTAQKAGRGKNLNTVDEIGEYVLKQYLGNKYEAVTVLSLNAANKIISFDVISEGDIDNVDLNARKVLEVVLRTSAKAVVLAHNHPSGLALPSKADIKATIEIKRFLNSVNVKLLDHIIVCDNDYVSLAISGDFKSIFDR